MMYFANITSTATEKIIDSGLGWVVSVILSTVIVILVRHIVSLYKEKDEIQEQRRIDMVSVNEKQNEILGTFSQTANLLLAKLSGDK